LTVGVAEEEGLAVDDMAEEEGEGEGEVASLAEAIPARRRVASLNCILVFGLDWMDVRFKTDPSMVIWIAVGQYWELVDLQCRFPWKINSSEGLVDPGPWAVQF
jgi:hypothetical protein